MTLALPIDPYLPSMMASINSSQNLLIKAEPGAGKTTRLPPALLSVTDQEIIVIEPRRLSARLSTERIAAELGVRCGDLVGYQVRFGSKISEQTRLKFVTEGIFLRILENNPNLRGIGCVVVDEFHERNIQTDIGLALTRFLQKTYRPDLRLIVMSATIDIDPLASYLDKCTVFSLPGRTFSLNIKYLSPRHSSLEDGDMETAVLKMTREENYPGNILIFVPGMREILRYGELLRRVLSATDYEILPLAADLSAEDQAKVFCPSNKRKIIISTNVAETSLTIPGITGVIDTGLAKIASHAKWSGFTSLDVKRISQANCIQRAGRAGRTSPGLVYRLYGEADFLGREPTPVPDIRRLDFSQYLLGILFLQEKWGNNVHWKKDIPWFEIPDADIIEESRDLLQRLGAIDKNDALTEAGRKMATIPLHPRLSAAILAGGKNGVLEEMILAACLINEGFLQQTSLDKFSPGSCDVCQQIDLMQKILAKNKDHFQAAESRNYRQIMELYKLIAKLLGASSSVPSYPLDQQKISACLLTGFSDRIGKLRDGPKSSAKNFRSSYNFCRGRGGILSEESVVKNAPWIIALDAIESQDKDASQGLRIRHASAIEKNILTKDPGSFLRLTREAIYNDKLDKLEIIEKQKYGELDLEENRQVPTTEEIENHLFTLIKNRWPHPFSDDKDLRIYESKRSILQENGIKADLPSFADPEMFDLLLRTMVEGKKSLSDITDRNLREYIQDVLGHEAKGILRVKLPDHLTLSNAKYFQIHYDQKKPPWIEGYIQDFFGVPSSPLILDNRITINVNLLAPNRRILQITGDLANFWKTAYPKIKGENQRKYPKHFWPDQPEEAKPVLLKRNADQQKPG